MSAFDGAELSLSSYVPVHLEFALTELLKNAFRASVEHHYKLHGASSRKPLTPVIVTIAPSSSITPRTPFLSMRIRDQGGGVSPANLPHIFSYAFTTAGRVGSTDQNNDESGGGPYAAQIVGGSAGIGGDGGTDDSHLFGEITGKGLQTGLGTLSGLGYGYVFALVSGAELIFDIGYHLPSCTPPTSGVTSSLSRYITTVRMSFLN